MKTISLCFIALLATFSGFSQKSKAANTDTKPTVVTVQYACPMHKNIISTEPGKCSKCGMDLALTKKEQIKHEVTNTFTCPMHKEVISSHEGICAKCSSKLVVERRGSKQGKNVFTCSMHPQVASNVTGKCPICGESLKN
jgi:putative DNA topoisomerase